MDFDWRSECILKDLIINEQKEIIARLTRRLNHYEKVIDEAGSSVSCKPSPFA